MLEVWKEWLDLIFIDFSPRARSKQKYWPIGTEILTSIDAFQESNSAYRLILDMNWHLRFFSFILTYTDSKTRTLAWSLNSTDRRY